VKQEIKRALWGIEGRVKGIFQKRDEIPDFTAKDKPEAKYNKEKIIMVSIISVFPIADSTHLKLFYPRQAL
jgi:hypothetical protein